MANFYSDESEWKWLFHNAIDWDKILPLYYPEYPTADGFNNKEEVLQFIEELVTATGEWCGTSVKDRARRLDEQGAGEVKDGKTIPGEALQEFYNEAQELALSGVAADQKFGGMGAPVITGLISFAQMNRACLSSATQFGFYTSIIDMIERFCPKKIKKDLFQKLLRESYRVQCV